MAKLLDKIKSPADLKELSYDELVELADEIRERLIESVSHTGGHLAANLGVVELTIALHRVLDCPQDKIVWDVGHQCYVHKLLTGRGDQFATLRQLGGLSGFPCRQESPHDTFNTGHGSTSISVALGMAVARDLAGGNETIVAVIGDGALTGGLALEGLNHAGHLRADLIVIVNDNAMSISPNVGALSGYLARLRLDPHYLKAKDNFETIIRHLPLGDTVLEAVDRFKDGLKQLLVPGMLFEELGFTYLGPIDGHNLKLVKETLRRAKALKGPVLIHLVTTKGKGYSPAEQDASRYHGVPPFDIDSGEPANATTGHSHSSVFGQTLIQLAERDDRIVAITAAMPEGTGLKEFVKTYPKRFFDVGMAETHAVTFAAGLANAGRIPVVAIYSTFLQRAYDQILHDVCLQGLPVVLAIDRAGIVGEDGPTHQGVFDLSYLRPMPNLTVMAPKDLTELAAMLRTAVELGAPAAIRYPRGIGANTPNHLPDPLPIGKAEVLRQGDDLSILAIGSMVSSCLQAAEQLESEGMSATVVNSRFAKPLDRDLILELARRTGKLVTVEDNVLAGGFGSGVMELLEAEKLNGIDLLRLGLPDQFIEHGARDLLLDKYGLTPAGIAKSIREWLA